MTKFVGVRAKDNSNQQLRCGYLDAFFPGFPDVFVDLEA